MAAHPETSILIAGPIMYEPFNATRAYICSVFDCYGTIWQSGCVGVLNTQPTHGLQPVKLFFRFNDDVSTYRFMTDTDGKLVYANQVFGVALIPSSAIVDSVLGDGECEVLSRPYIGDLQPDDVRHLHVVIIAAIRRAQQVGQDVLGVCLRKVYEESLYDQTLFNMLNSIMTRRPTQREVHRFQRHIRATRRLIEASSTATSVAASGPGNVMVEDA
ncbi:hypothetical protein N7G274_003756 [Stereocaulon virgatum]|uniref:Uncharacterized protein n=1 Tax=Stereocaulon virgatum TaxID=373712 RepID=A0ABR4AD82_9LECA